MAEINSFQIGSVTYDMRDERTKQNLASVFSTGVEYEAGDYVEYDTQLYQFIVDHPAGTWDASQVVAVNLAAGVSEALKSRDNFSTKAPVIVNTASGDVVSFADGADDMPIKKLVATIEPVQAGSGNPSPDNVRPISGWTGCEIGRCISLLNGITPHFETGWAINSTTGASNVYSGIAASCLDYLDVSDYIGKEVYLNHRPTGNVGGFAFYDSSKQYISGIGNNGITTQGEWIITIPDNSSIKYMRFTANTNYLDKVILCLVETKATLPINWQSEAGTIYGGTVTLNEDGSADVLADRVKITYSDIASGLTGFKVGTTCSRMYADIRSFGLAAKDRWVYNGAICNIAPEVMNTWAGQDDPTSNPDFTQPGFAYGGYVHIMMSPTITDANAFKATISDFEMVAPLVTSQSWHIPNVGSLSTYLGTNNVWIDTGAITECDYPADTKLYIDGITAPDEDMIANSNIASGKYFVVNNQLYLSTAAIAAGASIVPGTNCTATNLAEALNALNT